jgi:lambda repressor-like predicted transcriptional regulator
VLSILRLNSFCSDALNLNDTFINGTIYPTEEMENLKSKNLVDLPESWWPFMKYWTRRNILESDTLQNVPQVHGAKAVQMIINVIGYPPVLILIQRYHYHNSPVIPELLK